MKHFLLVMMVFTMFGCTNSPKSRYQLTHDVAPTRLPTANEILDIIPRYEPYSRGGNKDYTVRGISYQVLKDPTDYAQIGNASWYGRKFHGHLTSNGEIYNMYTLSAAHKSLPLPSFVRVTNLANNKQVIVRVNDRGPFHPDRIIDLAYGAAQRLGMLRLGTAKVKIELLTYPTTVAVAPLQKHHNISEPCLVQLAASSNEVAAQEQLRLVALSHNVPSQLEKHQNLYRMQLGPLSSLTKCDDLVKKVRQNHPKAFIKKL